MTGRRRFVISGGLAVVLLVGGASLWFGRSTQAPEPFSVTCEGAPLPEREPDGPGRAVPSAPTAAAGRPVPASAEPVQDLDYVLPSQRYQQGELGYRLDHDAARVSYLRGYGEPATPRWNRRLHLGSLSVGATITELPGSADLFQVVGELRDRDADLLVAAFDAAGSSHLSCVVAGVPRSGEPVPATLTPDAGVLLVPHVDEGGEEWVEAHATVDGAHLWSAPAVAAAADDRRVYLATGSTVSAREIASGEVEWEREVVTGFDDSPGSAATSAWDLVVVDDELYAHRRGAPRLVALDTWDGRVTWDLISGGEGSSRLRITELDEDHRVLVEIGDDLAVRAPSRRNWWWLHRGVDTPRVIDVLARVGEPTLIAFRPDGQRVVVVTDGGDRLADLALPDDDYAVAVAETMVYALHRDERTVTGFVFDEAEPAWTVPVVAGGDVGIGGISPVEEGFRVHLRDGTAIPFHGG